MAPDRLLPLRIRSSRGPRRGRAVDGEGGRCGRPAFAGLVPLAQATVYDDRLVASVSTPNAAMLGVDVPTTILRGDATLPLIVAAVERLAAAGPFERCVPESADHRCARRSSGRD
jgi:hypothetical protein